jgi:hypothetical protein
VRDLFVSGQVKSSSRNCNSSLGLLKCKKVLDGISGTIFHCKTCTLKIFTVNLGRIVQCYLHRNQIKKLVSVTIGAEGGTIHTDITVTSDGGITYDAQV